MIRGNGVGTLGEAIAHLRRQLCQFRVIGLLTLAKFDDLCLAHVVIARFDLPTGVKIRGKLGRGDGGIERQLHIELEGTVAVLGLADVIAGFVVDHHQTGGGVIDAIHLALHPQPFPFPGKLRFTVANCPALRRPKVGGVEERSQHLALLFLFGAPGGDAPEPSLLGNCGDRCVQAIMTIGLQCRIDRFAHARLEQYFQNLMIEIAA